MKEVLDSLIKKVDRSRLSEKIKLMFKTCLENTFTTTVKYTDRDDIFLITGDIDAMWLRDSSGQIRPLFYSEDKKSDEFIKKLIKRQLFCLEKDSYANAFNISPSAKEWSKDDITEKNPWVWERKYELDSLAYVLDSLAMYYEKTHDISLFDFYTLEIIEKVLDQVKLEQDHSVSKYEFERPNPWRETDSLRQSKRGTATSFTKMSWSGFRPSDDSCIYQYLIPSNCYMVKALRSLNDIFKSLNLNKRIENKIRILKDELNWGIKNYGVVDVEGVGEIFAYEVDGFGNRVFMDDANVPNLLSLPYLGYIRKDNPIYKRTRKFILSEKNEFYYEGKFAKGLGSIHTPKDYIWHLSLSIELMTSLDKKDQERILEIFEKTDAGTNLCHEGFFKDDPNKFTRSHFSWANSLFCEAILNYLGYEPIKYED